MGKSMNTRTKIPKPPGLTNRPPSVTPQPPSVTFQPPSLPFKHCRLQCRLIVLRHNSPAAGRPEFVLETSPLQIASGGPVSLGKPLFVRRAPLGWQQTYPPSVCQSGCGQMGRALLRRTRDRACAGPPELLCLPADPTPPLPNGPLGLQCL